MPQPERVDGGAVPFEFRRLGLRFSNAVNASVTRVSVIMTGSFGARGVGLASCAEAGVPWKASTNMRPRDPAKAFISSVRTSLA
ncbi:MAG: hypothetical protein WDN49_18765 [Acetobacteraceae bacterium]